MIRQIAIISSTFFLAGTADAASLYGLSGNQLVGFDSATPGTVASSVALTGLNGASLLGIDFRPLDGGLYGLGSNSALYRIDIGSGAATMVGSGFASLSGQSFGFDFNPTIDRIRVVSNTDHNYVINPADGTLTTATPVFYAAGDPNAGGDPDVISVAYTPSTFGAAATTTQLYGIDAAQDVLVKQANSAGTLTTVGSLGINASYTGGFDIAADGTAYLLDASTLYKVNLATGSLTSLGATTRDLFGLAVAPGAVPEPATWMAMLAGFGLVGAALRRRPLRPMQAV